MSADPAPPALHRAWGPDLTAAQLHALLRLRVDVFVVEQACAYAEIDGRDLAPDTRHYWLTDASTLLAGLRLLGDPDGAQRIGRLCTAPTARGRGLGRDLMVAALADVGDGVCVLDAQEHLVDYYAAFGFVPTGPAYDWDAISHVPMRRG